MMIDVPAALHHPSSLETARFPGGPFPLTGVLRGAPRGAIEGGAGRYAPTIADRAV
jgi:hypothetical protein